MTTTARDVALKIGYFTIPVIQSIAIGVGAYYAIKAINGALSKRI